jgi:hypothetical protein
MAVLSQEGVRIPRRYFFWPFAIPGWSMCVDFLVLLLQDMPKKYMCEVGGLLASGLLSIKPIGSVTSWRKIFFVEGLITTGIGVVCLFIIPADPERSRLLTKEERVLALKRIALDRVMRSSKREKTRLSLVLRAFNFNVSVTRIIVFHAQSRYAINLGWAECVVLYTHQHFVPRVKLVHAHCHSDA